VRDPWETKRVLITVKTYPTPAWKGGEVVCTAGVTSQGEWIRLFPIPYRLLSDDQQFKKYQWVEARVKKSTSDPRPESYQVDADSIRVVGEIPPNVGWASRWSIIGPLTALSMCELRAKQDNARFQTLGFFRPASIDRLLIEPTNDDWSEAELARLSRINLFDQASIPQLEKVPFNFYYQFHCSTPDCSGHRMSCTDWEMAQSYRLWLRDYGSSWQVQFRNRYEHEMKERYDTRFYVGTIHGHPRNWIIIGLWYPLKSDQNILL
jgi:hypothetical protein